MIIKVENRKQLKTFVHFIETLYHDDLHMVYPIFHVLTNELKREVLHKKEYTAILSYKNNVCVGRLLYTIADSKKQNKMIGYFSYFDCIDDIASAKELFNYAYQDLKTKGIDYIEGPFTPYDPDNRRGLLIKGFDSDPIIFTTYNYPYYERLLEAVGMNKAIDTVLLSAPVNKESKRKLNTFSKFFKRSHDVVISALDYKNIERE
ncbi:MAG: hypothetical protein JXR62_02355, partial [Bacilli bacterium]|nr:hypothetical protein [Bacilli bacterium]